jgi:hypothetical protein
MADVDTPYKDEWSASVFSLDQVGCGCYFVGDAHLSSLERNAIVVMGPSQVGYWGKACNPNSNIGNPRPPGSPKGIRDQYCESNARTVL